jgi:DNA-binding NtrC family response regulator
MERENILIVEDDEEILTLLEWSFNSEGYAVKKAKTLEELEENIKSENIDIIFCDIFINGKNCIEDLKEIKNKYKNLKLILSTGFDEIEPELKKLKFDYFMKPYKMEDVISKIKSFSNVASAQKN